ncbi:MAG TPA: hypothetical protein DGG94_01605 [Micromonosporaceae bacterium]|nr:hypothetical protein [Micromonosporaceae bacterium]HCU48523.1 hypothetical protein [Micromonosporaceae bacterium]
MSTVGAEALRDAESRLYAHYGLAPRAHHVDLPGVTVRVLEFGADTAPPMLLLHGIGSITALAAPLIAELARDRRILAIDWPGHGKSGRFRLTPDLPIREHAIGVIGAVMDHFSLPRADVVGHSMGAQFSLYFALGMPHRVRRLVLLGAPGAAFAEVTPAPIMRVMSIPILGRALLAAPIPRNLFRRSNEGMLGKDIFEGYPAELLEVGYLAGRRPGFPASLSSFFHSLITPAGVRPGVPVSRTELSTLEAPTLLIWGDRDLFLTPQQAQPSIAAIPNATLELVAGAGHAPWLNEPQQCADAIAKFLA